MGFLDKLGDIGIGRTDSLGADSAAYLSDALNRATQSQVVRDKTALEQEMLALTKGDKQINLEQMEHLAKKYQIPTGQVLQLATIRNNLVQAERVKKINKAYMSWVKANGRDAKGNLNVTPEKLQEFFETPGIVGDGVTMDDIVGFQEVRKIGYPEAKKQVLSEGSKLINEDTGETIADNPSQPKPEQQTGIIKQYIDMYGEPPKSTADLKRFASEIRPDPQPTQTERDRAALKAQVGELRSKAIQNPEEVARAGYRMTQDGTLYENLVDGSPEKLPSFEKVMGKRGQVQGVIKMGEIWENTKEIKKLLDDPEVKANLSEADKSGLWDETTGMWNNSIKKWLVTKGIAGNTKTAKAIARIQMLASEQRKEFLGLAVTVPELQSVATWLPNSGDSYNSLVSKVDLVNEKGEQDIKNILNLYSPVANMQPFYDAYKIKRFNRGGETQSAPVSSGFTKGKTYQDESGRVAKYLGGDPESGSSWQIIGGK